MATKQNSTKVPHHSSYSKFKKTLDREWPIIRTISVLISILSFIALVVTVIISNRQTSLVAAQVADQLSSPVITPEATYHEELSQDITILKQEMIDEYFSTISELSAENPNVPYHELLPMMPPITRTYPPGNVIVQVRILNTGNSPATNLSIRISWASSLTSLDVSALSNWQIVNGGEGYDSVTLSVQRLFVDETIEITANYAPPTQDIITISFDSYGNYSDPILGALSRAQNSGLPTFYTERTSPIYLPTNIQITIASDEIPAVNINPTKSHPQIVTQEIMFQATVLAPGTFPGSNP